ncbi:MAG: type II secretion system GspH family protein [Planctomycetaceae bacterium]|nr:type II secretion system GspH family protein [Planctomycetaceae bacterium]
MRTPNRHNTSSLRQGFTLTELLTVVAIIVLLIGTITVAISAATRRAQKAKTLFLMNTISGGLAQFQTDFGYLPPVLMNRGPSTPGSRGYGRSVTTVGQVGGAAGVGQQQNWFSYTTIPEYLIGYGNRAEDGYGVFAGGVNGQGSKENPPFGIRAPGSDGAWGSVDAPQNAYAAFPGIYEARNPNRDASPLAMNNANWNAVGMEGRVYGPYLELSDEKLLGGLTGIDAQGNPQVVTADRGVPNFDSLPKVILDYWGTPISYYRAPYSGSDLRSELPVAGGFANLADVFALRPWDVATGEVAKGALDANDDDTSSAALKGAAFALFSRGPDLGFDRTVRRDLAELNKDNLSETGR